MSSSNSWSESVRAAKKENWVNGISISEPPLKVHKAPLEGHTPLQQDFGPPPSKLEEVEIHKAIQAGTQLDSLVLDLKAHRAIFHIQDHVEKVFTQFLWAENFRQIHTQKFTDSGAPLDYEWRPACLAICGDFQRVFEIAPVLSEGAHKQLCEFTSIDVEMEIKKDYSEVMDIVDSMFVHMFDSLKQNCMKDLEDVGNHKPLKYLQKTLRLTYNEGIRMLKEVGVEIKLFGDLDKEAERKLGQLVLEKYDTEFYILHRYPLAVRPFYTMPCDDDLHYSNSFDVFIRGEKIILGAQHIDEPKLLEQRANVCGIDVNTISAYIDSLRYGAPLHGGFGADLERVVMLLCG